MAAGQEDRVMPTVLERTPVEPTEAERPAVRRVDTFLAQRPDETPARLVGPTGEAIELPPSIYRLLRQIVHYLAEGKAISVVPIDQELTTQQAANLLNISRPSLIRLLDEGVIPFTKTGSHRRVRFADVMAYREQCRRECRAALSELSRVGAEQGLYAHDAEILSRPEWTRSR